jgi:hypothetical protein
MEEDKFLGLKTVALILGLVGAIYVVNGLIDVRDYRIPGAWSLVGGSLMLIAGIETWRMKPRGWKVALGATAVAVTGWVILTYVAIDSVIAAEGMSGRQAQVLRGALDSRLRLSAILALLLAVWVYPARHKFIN